MPHQTYVGYDDSLSVWKIQIPKKVIGYNPFGTGIDADIVYGTSVLESTAGITEISTYQISFSILALDADMPLTCSTLF